MTEHMEMAEVTLRCEECVSNMTIDRGGVCETERDGEEQRNKTKILALLSYNSNIIKPFNTITVLSYQCT